jgi:8-oxo-dGTP pyrophosphatase MutT (NUDIX family)
MSLEPKILERRLLGQGRFLALSELAWADSRGTTRKWEMATRRTGDGAAMIIAWLQPSDRLLLIRQYRPPAECSVIEFPAGLIDAGEEAGATALRELREETGYTGRIERVFAPAYSTPGLTDERACIVTMSVDERSPENQQVRPDLQDGEDIANLLIPRAELPAFIERETAAGTRFDIKVVTYVCATAYRSSEVTANVSSSR